MLDTVKRLLSQDLLANISLLKMIDAYGDLIQCVLVESRSEWALVLLVPTALSPFDSAAYPDTEAVVYMSSSGREQLLHEAVEKIPHHLPFVFKVQRPAYGHVLETYFRLRKKRSFISYSSDDSTVFPFDAEVREHTGINGQLLPLWMKNGYQDSEIRSHFANGARSYSIWSSTGPMSTCLVFRNYDRVWEVGAVYTTEEMRGKGYAKKVVQAAVSGLLQRNLIPRYQVADDNAASVKLAESIGLKKVVVLDHLIHA